MLPTSGLRLSGTNPLGSPTSVLNPLGTTSAFNPSAGVAGVNPFAKSAGTLNPFGMGKTAANPLAGLTEQDLLSLLSSLMGISGALAPTTVAPTAVAPTTAIGTSVCILGRVTVIPNPAGFVGATNGTLTPFMGTPIPISQAISPAAGSISLTRVNNQFAIVCGTLTSTGLQVTQVIPVSLPREIPTSCFSCGTSTSTGTTIVTRVPQHHGHD